ncbi:putative uncharacterized protein [Firmicutes bacterium CAG:631]|mgnify:FL=1|nr:putative uncharacterized protein [Firmicutes bacterium CAG:631]
MVWFWIYLCVMVISIIVEVSTVDLTSFWFAIGALAALIADLCNAPVWLSLTIFSIVSIICIIFLRPIVKKKFDSATIPTNADSAIGKIVIVSTKITLDHPGEVKYEGIVWTAVTEKQTFEVGEKVKIIRIEGNKLIVESI